MVKSASSCISDNYTASLEEEKSLSTTLDPTQKEEIKKIQFSKFRKEKHHPNLPSIQKIKEEEKSKQIYSPISFKKEAVRVNELSLGKIGEKEELTEEEEEYEE